MADVDAFDLVPRTAVVIAARDNVDLFARVTHVAAVGGPSEDIEGVTDAFDVVPRAARVRRLLDLEG